jgi:hypothetical protein
MWLRLLRNPPIFLPGLLLCGFIWWLEHNHSFSLLNIGLVMGALVVGGIVEGVSYWLFWAPRIDEECKQEKRPTNSVSSLDSINGLLQWLEKEEAVKTPLEDRFEFKPIAKRITNVLKESKPNTVGLLGRYGSGKTSLLKMVEFYLKNPPSTVTGSPPKVITCWISGWGFHEDKAVEVILKKTVNNK